MKKILIPLLIAVLTCCSISACAEDKALTFDGSARQLFEGETLQTVLTREGDAAEGEVAYASSDRKVAEVDENGLVTGVSKGRAVITATVKTEKKTYRTQIGLTVARRVTSLSVNTAGLTVLDPADGKTAGLLAARENPEENELPVIVLPAKKSIAIKATAEPRDATNRQTALAADGSTAFTVRQDTVTAVAPGEGILTVSSVQNPEICQRFRILVVQPVTRLAAAAPNPAVAVGQQLTLAVQVFPEDATIQTVTWTSENEKIATVTADGVVTGVSRGNARIVATARDGSRIRANINVRVTQNPEEITFSSGEVTVDAGKTLQLKTTVLPRNADNKKVTWASSDESVATVDARGRVKAVSLGTCEITCSSEADPGVKASATVHVQQPVTRIIFNEPLWMYFGDTGKISWTVEPANASNPAVKLTSGNRKVLDVSDDGVITAYKAGEATITAVSTDGSNRRARVKFKVYQHVEGVHMLRHTAYVDRGETSTAGAVLEPKNAGNHNMSWETDDPGIATVSGTTNRVKITGVSNGTTTVRGTTEDGGFQTSIKVKIGDWEHALKLTDASVKGNGDVHLTVKNNSSLTITRVKAEVSVYDTNGKPVPANKNGGNTFTMVYKQTLSPGKKTKQSAWKYVDYKLPEATNVARYDVKVVEYEIDHDWVKMIRKKYQPSKKCPVHL